MFGKFVCWITNRHLRGKRTGISSSLGVQYRCDRCLAVWNRKVASKKEKV